MNTIFSRNGRAFDQLTKHKIIGWDLDQTLIESNASPLLHDFIVQHPEIQHIIVTFRSGEYRHTVWNDIANNTAIINKNHFKSLCYPSEMLHETYFSHKRLRESGFLNTSLTTAEIEYCEWKGYVCSQYGATALVDDLTHLVQPGCQKYNVQLFHPLQFIHD